MKLLLFIIFFVFSCQFLNENDTLRKNEKVPSKHYSNTQPASLKAYTELMSYSVGSDVAIIRPAQIPELVKVLKVDLANLKHVQIDREGYLWAVSSETRDWGIEQNVYVINPHSEKVDRVIALPKELSGPVGLAFGQEDVYLLSRNAGRNAGLGAINRENYDVRLLAELDSCGAHLSPSLELVGNKLYAFTIHNSLTDLHKIFVYNLETNRIEKVMPNSGTFTKDDRYFYTNQYFNHAPYIVKLDKETLEIVDKIEQSENFLLTSDETSIYTAHPNRPSIEVYSKHPLKKTGNIEVPGGDGIYTNDTFGFISTYILMIDPASFYNIKTGELTRNAFPINNIQCGPLTPPEGYQLKTFY